jgi:hypothetical protein
MNNAVHQLIQLILQGITWVLRTAEALWTWSWNQIAAVFAISWGAVPGWKLALGIIAIVILAVILFAALRRAWRDFRRVAAAFWTMAMMLVGILAMVVVAGLFSRGIQWVVASVPDHFWDSLI